MNHKEEIFIASGKFTGSRQPEDRAADVQENAFRDSSALSEEWARFLDTVDSRYGLQKPQLPPDPFTETPMETPQEMQTPREPELPQEMEAPRDLPEEKKTKSGLLHRVLLIAAALALLLVLGLGAGLAMEQFGDRIPETVSAAGVDLGGLTKTQAVKALKAAVGEDYTSRELVITLPDTTLQLSPKETGVSLNFKELAADACVQQIGEMELLPYLHLNETQLRSVLTDHARELSEKFTPSEYALEGSIPALEEGSFDPAAPCPKLVLTTGVSSYDINVDKLYGMIQNAYADRSFAVDAKSAVTQRTPEKLDLNAIRKALSMEPVDARMDTTTHKPIPGTYGMDFDLKEAQGRLNRAGAGERLEIALHYVPPEIIGQEVYFQDILGFCETPHSNNEKRNNNLKLACSVLNGIVLQPGDTLSYNDTLGERTEGNGYQAAPAYSGTRLVDSIGGGICQVSSTLYLSSLYAELETVERVNHGFPVSYIPYGLDATVSWGAPDLKIRNASEYPVKIVAEVADGFVRIWIMGTETRDYYVRMGFGSSGTYARAYVCKYDRATDEQISREQQLLSGYLDEVTSVRGEIGMQEAYINGNVRQQEPCEPTPEALKASMEYKKANQHAQ